jgi:alpha-ketoglutarate-dependent taurine dioxygenase
VELSLRPITPNFGLEITGIDFSQPVNAQVKKELNDSFSQYAVLVFPNQG